MNLLDKWWVSLFLYIWTILFVIGFEISGNYNQYVFYLWLAAGVLVFVSIAYQLFKKRWPKAVAGIVLSFGITVTGVVVIFLAGAFNSVTKGNTNTLDAAYYKAEFEDHTRLPFPPSASILVKDETTQGFGFENEFDAHCLIRLPKAEYQQLLTQISADTEFSKDNAAPYINGTVLAGKVKAANFTASYSHDDPGIAGTRSTFTKMEKGYPSRFLLTK